MTLPVSHIEEALKLDADGIVHLYEVTLKKSGAKVRFTNNATVVWQGNTYSYWPCQQDKDVETSDSETPRPALTVYNPDGVLTSLASTGEFDLALVVRKEVLQAHVTANTNLFKQRVWFIGRVSSANRSNVTFELRTAIDIPNFQIPPRSFTPPEFPFLVY